MSSPQNIAEALRARMIVDGALNTNLGGNATTPGRIYHQLGKQNDARPHLVFDVLSVRVSRYMGTRITYETDAHFDIYVDRELGTAAALGAGSLEENLFANLDAFALTVTGMDRGVVLFTSRGVRSIEEDTIRISSDARVIGTTT